MAVDYDMICTIFGKIQSRLLEVVLKLYIQAVSHFTAVFSLIIQVLQHPFVYQLVHKFQFVDVEESQKFSPSLA